MSKLELFSFFRSTAAWRVRIALNVKEIDHDLKVVWIRGEEHTTPEYLSLNPQGLVPAMRIGETVIGQSVAMMEYLEETYPEPAILPKDPAKRANVRAAALLVACDIHPLNNRRVLHYLKDDLELPPETVTAWEHKWVAAGYAGLEAQAAAHAGPYLFGDRITMADICLVPQVENGNRAKVNLADYPTLYRAYNAACELPAFEAAHPRNQADNPDV